MSSCLEAEEYMLRSSCTHHLSAKLAVMGFNWCPRSTTDNLSLLPGERVELLAVKRLELAYLRLQLLDLLLLLAE
jgi:hypothetical protein